MPGIADLVFSRATPVRAASTTVVSPAPIEASVNAADAALAAPTVAKATLDLEKVSAENVAILKITEQDKDSYAVEGFHTHHHPRTRIPRAKFALTELRSSADMIAYLEELRGTVEEFQQIAKWFKKLRDAHGDDLRLVIDERTATGVPWEMLRMFKSHLGALATTVRWKHVVDFDEEIRDLEVDPTTCKGSVVACPDAAPAAAPAGVTAQEFPDLKANMDNVAARSKKPFPTLARWRDELRTKEVGVALVYVLCHAEWTAANIGQLSPLAGGLGDEVPYADLLRDPGDLVAGSGSVVFLNACSSAAAVVRDDYLPARQLVGFAEPFLRGGAKAVIGTISIVHVVHAARFAREVLQRAADNAKTPLATILRDIRRDAVRRLDANFSDQEAKDWWFYVFHYVYYGNPFLVLELE